MIKTIAIVIVAMLAVLVTAVLAYAATRPDTFSVVRSTTIKAPPDKIFALLDDYRNFIAWSPYEKRDPAMKRTYGGPASGKGAVYEWDSSGGVGTGRMEITQSSPPSKVTMTLDFTRPFEAHNTVEFTLEPQGSLTEVTWAMHGHSLPYFAKVMHLFLNMDTMVGKDFEIGLANLKAITER
jgi:uncharacterized protein YndB with AHSA1/START domain